jgi:hypothetical protein
VAVPQDALDYRIIHTEAIQIRCQAPAETVPTVPFDSCALEHILHFPLITSVQIERMQDGISKDWARRGITASLAVGLQPLS